MYNLELIAKLIKPSVNPPMAAPKDNEYQKTTNDYFNDCLAIIDERGLRYEFEERAAILEYGGGMDRVDADRCAAFEILNRRQHA